MAWNAENEIALYQVVVNKEEQYCIWPQYREIPRGWRAVGKTGRKRECLDYIMEVWTGMRPLAVRKMNKGEAKEAGFSEALH